MSEYLPTGKELVDTVDAVCNEYHFKQNATGASVGRLLDKMQDWHPEIYSYLKAELARREYMSRSTSIHPFMRDVLSFPRTEGQQTKPPILDSDEPSARYSAALAKEMLPNLGAGATRLITEGPSKGGHNDPPDPTTRPPDPVGQVKDDQDVPGLNMLPPHLSKALDREVAITTQERHRELAEMAMRYLATDTAYTRGREKADEIVESYLTKYGKEFIE